MRAQQASQEKDAYYKARHWAKQHKLCLPLVPLPQSIQDVIEEWFSLVDNDGSGDVTTEELKNTFKVFSLHFVLVTCWRKT
jgi:hypothetical protein